MGEMADMARKGTLFTDVVGFSDDQQIGARDGIGFVETAAEIEADNQLSPKEVRIQEVEEHLTALLKMLREGTHWTTAKGEVIPVSQIRKRHARNIVIWLRRRARMLHDWSCFEFMNLPKPRGEQARFGYEDDFDRLNERDPMEWLMEQPLVVKLQEIGEKNGK